MSKVHPNNAMQMIPLAIIDVLNPRDRNTRIFEDIVGNIKTIGLKKPITVTPRKDQVGVERFLLICGEGRLKAFKALGEKVIPAIVVNVSDEDALIMSLAENIARRQGRTLDLLSGIEQLHEQGYDKKEIAKKTGLGVDYIHGILHLLKNGEERLLIAVSGGRIPLGAALKIAGAGNADKDVQSALQDAYESGQLRGNSLLQARKVIEKRRTLGRTVAHRPQGKISEVTSSSLIRTYQNEVSRQKMMVKRAEFVQQCLLFTVEAMRQLLANENFVNLLRAEGLESMPKYVADRIES
jgi:ParB family chromosome partitioning protein